MKKAVLVVEMETEADKDELRQVVELVLTVLQSTANGALGKTRIVPNPRLIFEKGV